jgi:hypothetical protein
MGGSPTTQETDALGGRYVSMSYTTLRERANRHNCTGENRESFPWYESLVLKWKIKRKSSREEESRTVCYPCDG